MSTTTTTNKPRDDRRVDVDAIRRQRQPLDAALRDAKAVFHNRGVYCPFHEDRRPGGTPSGSVYCGEDGVWRFKCHSCGVNEDAIGVRAKAENRDSADVIRDMARDAEPPKPPRVFADVAALLAGIGSYATVEDHYPYTDPDTGRVDLLVVRCRDNAGKKSFLQASPAPGGNGFVQKRPPGVLPLFNRRRVRDAERVVVVEGEKCVKALHAVGVVATTSPMGAGKAGLADWGPLAGKREVYLWPDNDDGGIAHMRDVAERIGKTNPPPARVLWVDPVPLGLGAKHDAVDFIERTRAIAGEDSADAVTEAVETALSRSLPTGPAAKVRKLIEATISGKRQAVRWPWRTLGAMTNALMPGMVTILCGGGGSTKTYFMLDAARYWHKAQIPVAVQALEEHEDGTHLLRSLVQESRCSDLMRLDWVKENPDDAREIYFRHEAFLDSFGARLWAVPGEIPTLADLADWVRDRARDRARIICIDPITAAETSDKPWADDKTFIRNTQNLMRDYGASLLLVTHPKKGSKPGQSSMDDVAGGAAYQRHTQTVLWLNYFEQPKTVKCKRILCGVETEDVVEINRSVKVYKCTNGVGRGAEIGFTFNHGMSFDEHGMIVRERREAEAA